MHKYRTAALLLRRRGFFTFWDWKGATWHVKINYTNRETNVYGDSEADMLKNNADTVLQDQAHFVIYGTKGMLYLCDPNGFGGEIRFLPNKSFNGSWEAAAPVTLAPVNPYSDNSRGVGVSEMVSAILEKRKNRASCEMAVHVLDVLTCILKSSEDREIKKTSTTFSLPEPFAVL